MILESWGATEEVTSLAPRWQVGPTIATPTRSAPTPSAPSHVRAERASPAVVSPATTSTSAQVLPRPRPGSHFAVARLIDRLMTKRFPEPLAYGTDYGSSQGLEQTRSEEP